MKFGFLIRLLLIIIIFTIPIKAQDSYDIQIEKINDHFYWLSPEVYQAQPTIIMFVSDDGTLLVDTGVKETENRLKTIVDSLGNGNPKYILNSHMHRDHTGANGIFGSEPIIIAREGVRDLLLAPRFAMDEFPQEAMPDIEFKDSLILYFGNEIIKMISLPIGHTDNDVLIYFSNSKIAYIGDIAFGLEFPSVDILCGDASKFADAVKMTLDILPDEFIIVAGHGRIMTRPELVEYHQMLVDVTKTITEELASGKDTTDLVDEKVLSDWDSYGQGEVSTKMFTMEVARDVLGYDPPKPLGPQLYYAFKENGVEATINRYHELKKSSPDDYLFSSVSLCRIGEFILNKGNYEDAVRIFNFAVNEYPKDWIPYYFLGYCYLEMKNFDEAKKQFEKGLEQDPENNYLLDELMKLKKGDEF